MANGDKEDLKKEKTGNGTTVDSQTSVGAGTTGTGSQGSAAGGTGSGTKGVGGKKENDRDTTAGSNS